MPPNEPSGLLSKVVKFVRNPTTNWSDLDQPELDKESQYSKQMLKEMIERKKRNDFVRRREFDQLRKLRQREAQPSSDAVERPSFFQSSMQSKLDDRAGTIKKIDDIEAQMSRQWWKAKDTGASQPVRLSGQAGLQSAEAHPLGNTRAYAPTEVAALPTRAAAHHANAFAPTDVSPLRDERHWNVPTPSAEPIVDMLAALDHNLNLDFDFGVPAPAPKMAQPAALDLDLPDLDAGVYEHNPDLEEAAIRFANGDVEGAEAALHTLLRQNPAPSAHSEVWTALFDLYRATNQQDRFDTEAIDFAGRFGRTAPAWFSIPDQAGLPPASFALPDSAVGQGSSFTWACPAVLSAASVASLQAALHMRTPVSVQIGWASLGLVDSAAVQGLGDIFEAWADQAVQLIFADVEHLQDVLKSHTVSGDATAHPQWWRVRLALLRILQSQDAFDMVALEYCITYEVSPPAWQAAHCSYAVLDAQGNGVARDALGVSTFGSSDFKDSDTGVHTLPPGLSTAPVSRGALSGLVLGDASQALAVVDAQAGGSALLVVACDTLVRIDFSAAGSVLNWAADQHAAGRQVQFNGLHRLAAIFFNVIGINENATVIPRRN
ncbi:STAS domain-containing protein [Rhodoferax sp.]|uniref:STAS domain-containing protein n=1 Tax=Rhodoferax sp. TaxID=50421 RepID=UPI0025E2C517|nr:STAS domain-containing protein [Rhodoferax sp.]